MKDTEIDSIQVLPLGTVVFNGTFKGLPKQKWVVTRPPTKDDPNHSILHSSDRIADFNLRSGALRISQPHSNGADANAFLDDEFFTVTLTGVNLHALRQAISQAKPVSYTDKEKYIR